MTDYGLSEREKALVRARDWTGLVASGGHHFNVIKIAAAVGESHLHVGAHMCGANWDEFKRTLPHRVELMPDDLDRQRADGAHRRRYRYRPYALDGLSVRQGYAAGFRRRLAALVRRHGAGARLARASASRATS